MKHRFLPLLALSLIAPNMRAADIAPEDKTVFDGVVLNIFTSKCIGCHGPSKQKGKLRLDTYDAMIKGGDSGKASIAPKNSAGSESIARVILPAEHDDHMPPKDKPQLTAEELNILKWWVDAGADAKVKVKEANAPAELKDLVLAKAKETYVAAAAAPPTAAAIAAAAPPVNARDEKVIALEKEVGSPILQVAQNDAGLTFNVINVADKFDDATFAKFAPIADRFSDLNLGRSKLTDAGLASLAGMKNLQRLRLENTGITDAGLDAISGLPKLEYLNLYGTKITDAGLAKLEKLANLKSLYVWQTGVTKPAAEALHAKLPKLIINMGWETVIGAPTPPPVAVAAPTPPPAPAAAPLDPEAPAYTAVIQPIFNQKCTGCHGTEKQKGKLAMHDFASLMKGGENQEKQKSVVPGKSADSLIVARVLLPIDQDEHMPPAKKPQLTEKELNLVKWWIDAGASADVKVKDAKIPADLLK